MNHTNSCDQNDLKPVESWNRLPNEIRAMIVQKSDTQTRISLKQCGVAEFALVRWFSTTSLVDIWVKSESSNEFTVHLMESSDKSIVFTWTITRQQENICTILQKSQDGATRYSKTVESELVASLAFRIVGRLFSDSTFFVKKLELQLEHYIGDVDFGLTHTYVEDFVLHNTCRPIVTNSCLSYNFKFGNVTYVNDPNYVNHGHIIEPIRTLVDMSVGYLVKEFGEAYSVKLPLDCQIQSYEDGRDRMSNVIKALQTNDGETQNYVIAQGLFEGVNEEIIKEIESDGVIHNIMIIRAAYTMDPVTYLKSEDINYVEKIRRLREGMWVNYLNLELAGWLTFVYIAQFFPDNRMRGRVYGGFEGMLRKNIETFEDSDFKNMMNKIEQLSGRNMTPRIQYKT